MPPLLIQLRFWFLMALFLFYFWNTFTLLNCPLARLIDIYTMKLEFLKDLSGTTPEFPAHREVDRELYVFGVEEAKNFYYVFPAPSEVDRYL